MALQMERPIEVSTPLGDDVLLFRRMEANEELSRLFEYELDLLSENASINLEDVVGQNVTVRVNMRDEEKRYFNGFVSRFAQVGTVGRYAAYRATLRPWLWFLTRTSDCRIFQDISVPGIIKKICEEHGFSGDIEDLLSESYREWTYCVQYRETDYNFLARLMEQEGIYFYFKHEEGRHKLVLADAHSSHELIPGYEEVPFHSPDDADLMEGDHLYEWSVEQEFQSCAYALNDFDFERPRSDLKVLAKASHKHPMAELEMYDYPGVYCEPGAKAEKFATRDFADTGKFYAESRINELQCQYERASGRGNARGLYAGGLFELTDFPREDQNREYLILSASHELEVAAYETSGSGAGTADQTYSCRIIAMDSKQPFRPPRITPKPIVQGPQTAVVTGPSGEEIWTDQYGRVKVQFPWDRYGEEDENSSCWVRVASIWAGATWGGIQIPRIGQEVIVEFLEGDPDRPLITGRVYNGDNMPPYALPDNRTQSGIKSRSSKSGGGGNFNELRFEDKKGEEEVYFHAEKNHTQITENDRSEDVGNDRKLHVGNDLGEEIDNNVTTKIGVNQAINVGNNRDLFVKVDDKTQVHGSQKLDVFGQQTTNVTGPREVNVSTNHKRTVTGNEDVHVMGFRNVQVDSSHWHKFQSDSFQLVYGHKQDHFFGTKVETTVAAGSAINLAAKMEATTGLHAVVDKAIKVVKAQKIDQKVSGTVTVDSGGDQVHHSDGDIAIQADGQLVLQGKSIVIDADNKITLMVGGARIEITSGKVTSKPMIEQG